MPLRAVIPLLVSVLLLGFAAVPGAAADEPAYSVRGVVVDTAGRPVEYAGIIHLDFGADVIRTTTGADGRFEVRGIVPGAHRFRAAHDPERFVASSAATVTVDVTDGDVDGVRLTVRRNGNIVVRTVNEAGAPLQALYPVARRGATTHARAWSNDGYVIDDMTLAQQRERRSYAILTRVPDGTYDIVGIDESVNPRAYSHRVTPSRVTVANGSSPVVTVTLARKARAVFTGRVLARNGKPLRKAIVRPYSPGNRESGKYENRCWPATASTDRTGAYTVSCVDRATPRIVVTDPAWRHVATEFRPRGRLGATTTVPRVRLKRSATVSARILSSSGSALRDRASLEPLVKRGKKFVRVHRVVPDLAYGGSARVSRVRGLPAGTYRFCYVEGDGHVAGRHRDRCPKKTYKVRAGTSRTLPTVRLRR